ncbi:MAG: type I-G CRISPR-associated protein Csb2 [Terriglobales bacterium]
MRLILRQSFPLGRFHATRWKANPFDKELAGEWPPSPWRLTRAVVARWYQWRREEAGTWSEDELKKLIRALCTSDYSVYLPKQARQAIISRQYQPAEFGMDPPNYKSFEAKFTATDGAEQKLKDIVERIEHHESHILVRVKKKSAQTQVEKIIGTPLADWRGLNPDPGARGWTKSLTQDSAWCISPDECLFWFVEGDGWTPELAGVLNQCLERIVYFGRAEALTRICVTDEASVHPNVILTENSTSDRLAPVLVPCFDATRADIERVTQDPLAARNIPQGARLLYAQRSPRPPAREIVRRTPMRPATNLLQFALGWAVAPKQRATVRLTSRFRTATLNNLIRIKTNGATTRWSEAPASVRAEIAGMTGKDAQGQPLRGPRTHAEFFLWWDGNVPTRLLIWRDARPFDENEQEAMLSAAAQELSWAAVGPDAEAWKIKLVPLDTAVPAPPGFDGASATVWRSLTPYVPPRHNLRGGKPRDPEALENQIRRELAARGYRSLLLFLEEIDSPTWVAVHVPRREACQQSFIGDRRGYRLCLSFEAPISGPFRLGHSSSFGLGMFVPI